MAQRLTTLPKTARTIVYEQIVATLKADTTLASVVSSGSWTTFLEDQDTVRNTPLDNNGLPAISLMPLQFRASPEANVLQNSPFGITAILTVAGLDIRDLLNFWGAFERALFPGDGSKSLTNAIRAAIQAEAVAQGGINLGSIQTLQLGAPAVAASADTKGNTFLTAEGSLIAIMTVPK